MGYNGSRGAKFGKQKDARFFSLKPPKADQKALAAALEKDPNFVLTQMTDFPTSYKLSVSYDVDNKSWKAVLNLGDIHGDGKDCMIITRGQSNVRAMALACYWLKSTPIDVLFPPDDEDGDDFVF